jgi:hypothetical protein
MAERRFDTLTKSLARPVSRRSMIRGVVAAALGSVVASEAAGAFTITDPRTFCYNVCESNFKTYGDRLACYRSCTSCPDPYDNFCWGGPCGTGYCGPILISDRNVKADFSPVDSAAVLEGVISLPLSTWRYQTEEAEVRHLGPMAQDFAATFGLGESDTRIQVVDGQGVTLAAIQGLHQLVQQQAEQLAALQEQLALMQREVCPALV